MDEPTVDYSVTFHSFLSESLPFFTNFALRETTATAAVPSEWAMVNSTASNFHVDNVLNSFGEQNTAKEHVLVDRIAKEIWFPPNKFGSENEQPERTHRLDFFPTNLVRILVMQWNNGSDEFIF